MQKRRKRKKGYGNWWLAVGQVAKGSFYMRKHFMDCVGVCRLHACGVEVFKVCGLQRGEIIAKLGLGFICVYVVGVCRLCLVVE